MFSPDGRWVAYSSDESGQYEVYLRSYPGPGPKLKISTDGGTSPAWNPNGRELLYRGLNQGLWVASISTAPELAVGQTELVFEAEFLLDGFDLSADGQQFSDEPGPGGGRRDPEARLRS